MTDRRSSRPWHGSISSKYQLATCLYPDHGGVGRMPLVMCMSEWCSPQDKAAHTHLGILTYKSTMSGQVGTRQAHIAIRC